MGGLHDASFWREVQKTFGQRPELPGPSWATQASKRGKWLLSSFQLRKHIWLKNICQALCPRWRIDVGRLDPSLRRRTAPSQNFSLVGAGQSIRILKFTILGVKERHCWILTFFHPESFDRIWEAGSKPTAPSALFWQVLYISELLTPHQQREAVCPSANIKKDELQCSGRYKKWAMFYGTEENKTGSTPLGANGQSWQ